MKASALLPGFLALGLPFYGFAQGPLSALPSPIIQNVTNAPNPFDSRRPGLEGQTQISYVLIADSNVRVTVYDLFGVKVRTWAFNSGDDGGRAGQNQFSWDGTNAQGQKVAKGGYLALIAVDNPTATAKTIRKIGVIH